MDSQTSYLTFNKNLNIFNLNSENIKNIIKKAVKNKLIVLGSGGSNNIIIIKNKLNLVIKIVPTIKNNLLKKQYNNDLLEIEIYKKLTNEFSTITPHIVYCYKSYIINDAKILFPNKCLSFDERLVIGNDKLNQNIEYLCMLKRKYDKKLLSDKLNIITLEYCSTDISTYFENIITSKKENNILLFIKTLKRIIFQVLFTLAIIQDKYPNFIHNDLFLRNILAIEETIWKNNDYVQYNFNNKSYYLPANGIYIKITDFGYTLNILNKKSTLIEQINNDIEDLFEINNPLRDVYTFFYDLYDGSNLGALSLKTIIHKYSKNKHLESSLIKILNTEISKFFNYSKIIKLRTNNSNFDWEWNISDSNLLKSSVKKPNQYFNTNVFNEYLRLPKDSNIIKIFN